MIAQMTKLRVIRKRVVRLYWKWFTNDTYWSLSDDTIIMPSSDKKEMVCIKRKSTKIAQQGKHFWAVLPW